MPAKQTIALIGAASAEGQLLLPYLLPTGHRLLLMDEAAEKLTGLQQQLLEQQPLSDTDTQPCCREACWEADIIVLAKARPTLADTLLKIREVATTKIVVCLLHNGPQVQTEVERYLPHSRIVYLHMHGGEANGPRITGENNAAIETINSLFKTINTNE